MKNRFLLLIILPILVVIIAKLLITYVPITVLALGFVFLITILFIKQTFLPSK